MATKRDEDRQIREQRSHLETRISKVRYIGKFIDKMQEPAAVTKARQTIETWEAKKAADKKKLEATWEARVTKAREIVVFKDPSIALPAVQDLEAAYRRLSDD